MKSSMQKFEKELQKLHKRGATGISIFVADSEASVDDIAAEAILFLKRANRRSTKSV